MAQQIISLAPTTETEAINAMLSAIGEAPVADASTATQADVAMAYNLLKWATRELQSVPWKFNFESGVELAPANTVLWSDSSGALTLLNVFKPPTGISQWRMTQCYQNGAADLVQRPSKFYTESDLPVIILYDRAKNRDGLDATTHPLVYIDALYAFNFEQMPETARRYATVVAGRRFAEQVVGSQDLAGFQERDEAIALASLRKDQQEVQDLNMLDTFDAFRIMGGRQRTWGGFSKVIAPGANAVPVPVRLDDLSELRIVDDG